MRKMRVSTGRRTGEVRSRPTGFTLIELLVVIVILGILMAVAVPTFLAQQTKAQDSRTQQYLTTAFKAIRSGTPDTNDQYPSSTSMVSWITASEPELTAKSGDCLSGVTSAPVDAVLVDPSSTPTSLQLCARSQSGNVWKLTASATGAQQLLDGTLVPLTVSGNEITDATRAADVQGDGLSNDSSTGIWEGTTNLIKNGGFESTTTGWAEANPDLPSSPSTISRDTNDAKFGGSCGKLVVNGLGGADTGSYTFASDAGSSNPATTFNGQLTASAWLKAKPGQSIFIRVVRGLASGGTQWSTAQDVVTTITADGTWQHLSATLASYSGFDTTSYAVVRAGLHTAGLQVGDWAEADGIQLEQKPIATPYVETNGATATRNADRVQAPASLLNATQGWVAVRTRMGWDSGVTGSAGKASSQYPRYFEWTQDANDRFFAGYDATVGHWLAQRIAGGVGTSASNTTTFSRGDLLTVIFAWDPSGVKLSVDGGAFSTGTGTAVPPITAPTFDIGESAGAFAWDGDILWFACGMGTLTNSDAATINSWGNTDPSRSSFPTAAKSSMVWNSAGSSGSLK